MAHFVRSTRGYVNLDYVAVVEDRRSGAVLLDANGSVIGETGASAADVVSQTMPIVPAAPNTKGYRITVWGDDGRPTENDVSVTETVVVAWKWGDDGAVPVVPGYVSGDDYSPDRICGCLPDGSLISDEGLAVGNLNDAKVGFLRDAQRAWDIDHADNSEAA